MSPEAVLFIMPGALDGGRVASYVLQYLHRIDPERVRIDFLVYGMDKGAREDEARALGCRVYHVPPFRKSPFRNLSDVRSVLRYGGYSALVANADGGNGLLLLRAKRAGIPVRVSMSHSVRLEKDRFFRRLLLRMGRRILLGSATHLLARSTLAGRFLYGRKAVDEGRVTVFKDAIELDMFRFDETVRASVRAKLHLEDSYLIGHVGRFDPLKNYEFLVDLFAILSRRMPEAVLVLVGRGRMYGDIIRRIRERGIEDRVRLLGYRTDVPELLCAFDCFVLPSRAEGLPVTAVEAQASGLPCIVSLAVPTEACVADLTFLPLSDMEAWMDAIRAHKDARRQGTPAGPFVECGFDIRTEAERMQAFFEAACAETVDGDSENGEEREE